MANQYKNKVVYGGNTLIDLTGDTVDAEHLLVGYTAHDATGAPITGTATTTGHEWTSGVYQDAAGYLRVSPLAAAGGAKMVGGYLVLESTMEGSGASALGTKTITSNGTYNASSDSLDGYSSVTVNVPTGGSTLQSKTATYTPAITAQTDTISADSGYDGLSSVEVTVSAIQTQTKTATPSEVAQTIAPDSGKYLTSVEVGAISSTYVGSGITRRDDTDLSASGATVTVPAGYYADQETKSVASGTEGTPTASKGTVSNHSVTVTPSVTNGAGYITGGTHNGAGVTVSASELVSGTYTVDSSGTKDVTNYASASVPAGTAGTPSATKGTVSNHSISVTPSVTNTTGWITGSTKTGTAVTVSASELVSGSETKTANGTYDVTNLAEIVVNVSGSTGKKVQVNSNAVSVKHNGYTASTLTLTVAKSGTYNISWMAWRSSSQGTMGTNLHINSTSGADQQTFTNTYGQHIQLSNQTLTEGDVLTIYATSGSNSRYIWVGNLIIEEV